MKRLLCALILFALSTPLAAQQKREFFAFADSPGGGWSEARGTTFDTGYGVSFRFYSSEHFSTELSVAQRYVMIAVAPDVSLRLRTNPADLVAAYHFANGSNWKPYVGLGLHHLYAQGADYSGRNSGEVTGGVAYQLTPKFFVCGDLMRLLRSDTTSYDQRTRALLGFGWRF